MTSDKNFENVNYMKQRIFDDMLRESQNMSKGAHSVSKNFNRKSNLGYEAATSTSFKSFENMEKAREKHNNREKPVKNTNRTYVPTMNSP